MLATLLERCNKGEQAPCQKFTTPGGIFVSFVPGVVNAYGVAVAVGGAGGPVGVTVAVGGSVAGGPVGVGVSVGVSVGGV